MKLGLKIYRQILQTLITWSDLNSFCDNSYLKADFESYLFFNTKPNFPKEHL